VTICRSTARQYEVRHEAGVFRIVADAKNEAEQRRVRDVIARTAGVIGPGPELHVLPEGA